MQDDKEPQGNPWMKSVMIWSGILLAMLLVACGARTKSTMAAAASSETTTRVATSSPRALMRSATEFRYWSATVCSWESR